MKCIACNEDIIDNSPYCPYCGEAQPTVPTAAPVMPKEKNITVSLPLEEETPLAEDVPAEKEKDVVGENISENTEPIPAENDEFILITAISSNLETPIVKTELPNEEPIFSAETIETAEVEVVKDAVDEFPLEDTSASFALETMEESTKEQEPITENTVTDISVTAEENDDIEKKEKKKNKKKEKQSKKEKSPQKGLFNKDKNKKGSEEPSIANEDGYYTETTASKSEKFPVSKGEIIAKFILLGLLLVSIALFMIYVIQ